MRKCAICNKDCGKYKWCDPCRPKDKNLRGRLMRQQQKQAEKNRNRILPSTSSSANTAVLSQQQTDQKSNSLSVQQLLNGQNSSTTSIASLSSQISMAPVVQHGQSHSSGSNAASLQQNSEQISMAPVVQHGQTNHLTRPATSELFDAYALSCNKVNELFSQLIIEIHNRDRLRDKCLESVFKS